MGHTICQGSLRAIIRVTAIAALLCGGLTPSLDATEDVPSANLQPAPDAASQAAALKVVKELFKPYPPQRPEEKVKVAKKLMDQATGSGNDPVTQFVVLREAAELSAAAGDINAAMHAVDEIGKHFAIDPGMEKLQILSRTKGSHLTREAASAGADAALQIGADAMRKGEFDAAGHAAALATTFVRETQDVKLTLAAQTLTSDVRKAQSESARAKIAETKLKAQPTDPAASLTSGRFLCFWRGDWARGLPLLAQGSDAVLKSIAAEDFAAPTQPAAQFALAEKWVALASKESGTPRTQIRQHAAAWCERAQAGLSGIQKALAEKRLAELRDSTTQPASFASKEKENALTRLLNDPAHWIIKHGEWKNEQGKLHGEGDSEIWFDTRLPRDIVFSFQVNVIKGTRPRMDFYATDMKFANEGNTQTLYPHGTNLTVKKEGFPYQNNQPHLLVFKLSGNHFEIEIDQKSAYSGTYKATAEPIQLRFHGGDGWSPGITEFYGFKVESLPTPSTATGT